MAALGRCTLAGALHRVAYVRPNPANFNFIPTRKLTLREAKGTLVPFYRAVHPDLFHSYPHHKAVNEESLKQLHSYIQCSEHHCRYSQTESSKQLNNLTLQFYLHPRSASTHSQHKQEAMPESPKPVKVHLLRNNLKASVHSILRSCNLEEAGDLDTVGERQSTGKQSHFSSSAEGLHASVKQYYEGRHCYFDDDGVFFNVSPWQRQGDSLSSLKFPSWLKEVATDAEKVQSSSKPAREALSEVVEELCSEYGCNNVATTCSWSPAVALGIVKGMKEVLDSVHDKEALRSLLAGSVVHVSHYNAVSLDGAVHFSVESVPQEWRKFLSVAVGLKHQLNECETMEEDISRSLGGIRIRRPRNSDVCAYYSSLKTFNSSFSSNPTFLEGSLQDHALTLVSPSVDPSVSADGTFLIPCDMTQYQLENFIRFEEGKASRAAEIAEQRSAELEKQLEDTARRLHLHSLTACHSVTRSELLYFCSKVDLALSGQLWEEGLEPADFHPLRWQRLCVDGTRALSPEGVIHVPWDLK